MSSMLEQAIIDAEALREVALKNAESAVIEKYSVQIKEAVEKLYDVKVLNVKTSILPGKVRKAGKATVKSSKSKKAFVQVEEGQKIEFFKGV